MNWKIFGAFLLGAVAGVAASWKFAQRKWEAFANEDIRSVKEAYGRKLDEMGAVQDKPVSEPAEKSSSDAPLKEEFRQVVKDLGYVTNDSAPATNYADKKDATKRELNEVPYVIRDNLYGSEGDYVHIALQYEIDLTTNERKLTDEASGQEENEFTTLGEDVIEHIDNHAEWERNGNEEFVTIHVRDDILKIDYEIECHRW